MEPLEEVLPHTAAVEDLLAQRKREQARRLHNARVKSELDRAQNGATINLSDLMAAKEQLDLDAS